MKYLTIVFVLGPLAAAAQTADAPKSVNDCERIRNDLAYNQCLASFGPKRGEKGSGGMSVGEDDDISPARGSRDGKSARGGRQAATFDVLSGKRSAGSSRRP